MKSNIPQQGSWRTSDGSAWSLRDTRYNDPNGAYHANCYLHIYDVNPNNVRFNDGNCAYSTTDYLCQKAKLPRAYFQAVSLPSRRTVFGLMFGCCLRGLVWCSLRKWFSTFRCRWNRLVCGSFMHFSSFSLPSFIFFLFFSFILLVHFLFY